MTSNTPERPETAPAAQGPTPATDAQPTFPPAPPTAPSAATANLRRHPRKRALIATVAVVALLVGGGITWWALAEGDDPMSHVEVSGGKITTGDDNVLNEDEECDDADEFTFNDCDASITYEFIYKITNEGDEHANYAVIVNGFDKDGDFVGQSFISATHLGAGKTDADTGQFDEYDKLESDHKLSDIASVKVAYVERVALAN